MENNVSSLIEKVKQKKEFSQLPDSVVKLALQQSKGDVKKTRALLRKVFSAFLSSKLLKPKAKEMDSKEILKKHSSTRERFENIEKIYCSILNSLDNLEYLKKNKKHKKEISVIDLGAGVNGFSYFFLSKNGRKLGYDINYIAIEAVGQLVDLMNNYFKKQKLLEREDRKIRAKAIYLDIFNLSKITEIINNTKKPRIIFLFKMIGPIESLKRNYSKKLILGLVDKVDIFVLSFATKSLGKKLRFGASRGWLVNFLKQIFKILDDFDISGERFIIFKKILKNGKKDEKFKNKIL